MPPTRICTKTEVIALLRKALTALEDDQGGCPACVAYDHVRLAAVLLSDE